MKKTIKLMSIGMIMAMCLISCNKDDSKDSLIGWYVANLPAKGSSDYGGSAYHFINSNTVEYYGTVAGSPIWVHSNGVNYSEELPSPLKGYYIQEDIVATYTYTVIDNNKIYIPKQGDIGRILTISGNDLIPDTAARFKYTKL